MSQRPLIALGAALVLLLVAANIQLLRLTDRTDTQKAPTPRSAATPSVAPLPEERASGGTSTRALVNQLDRTTTKLQSPIAELQKQLEGFTRSTTATFSKLAPGLNGLSDINAGFSATLRQLRSLGDSLGTLKGIAKQFSGLRRDLRPLQKLGSVVRGLHRSLLPLTAGVGGLSSEVSSVRESLTSLKSTLEDANGSLDKVGRCLKLPVLCK